MSEDLMKELDSRLAKLQCLIAQSEEQGDISTSEAAMLRAYNESLRQEKGLSPPLLVYYVKAITVLNNLKQQNLKESWLDAVQILAFRSQLKSKWCESALKELVSEYGEVAVREWLIAKLENFIKALEACGRLPRGIADQGEMPFWSGLSWYESEATRTFDKAFIFKAQRAPKLDRLALRRNET